MIPEILSFRRVDFKYLLVGDEELLSKLGRYLIEIAYQPAAIFILRIIRETNKITFSGYVREKREGSTGYGPKGSLTLAITQTFNQDMTFRDF